MQALGKDLLEAIAHAKTMTTEEVEEMIDYLLNEVFPSSVVTADFSLTFWVEHSMEKTPLAVTHI